jgi:hypothetical protein
VKPSTFVWWHWVTTCASLDAFVAHGGASSGQRHWSLMGGCRSVPALNRVEICFETSPKQESTFARGLCWHGGPRGSRILLPNQCCSCSAAYAKLAAWVLETAFVDPRNRANSGAIVPSSEALAPSLFQASEALPNRSFHLPHARLRKELMMAFARTTAAAA